jgi:D-alanyl-D-alanine dipeptidase
VVLGAKGAAWGHGFHHLAKPGDPLKREGDKRTPAGVFAFGRPFGFAPSPLPGFLHLQPDTVCVDDPSSDAYNTITAHGNVGDRVSVESMHSGSLYRRGIVVRYLTSASLRSGSCIFIHVWKSPTAGTAGCIALPEARVAALQEFAVDPTAVLAVLPNPASESLARCLPPRITDAD